MTIGAIASSGFTQLANVHRKAQQMWNELHQSGASGSAIGSPIVQKDVVTLSKAAGAQPANISTVAKTLNTIGQALQSSDLAAAQKAFLTLPVAVIGPCAVPHGSRVPPMQNSLSGAFSQLGQALQGGDLSAAQQALSAVQQGWSQAESGTLR